MEYEVFSTRYSNLETALNYYARNGWRLSAMTEDDDSSYTVVMERQKPINIVTKVVD